MEGQALSVLRRRAGLRQEDLARLILGANGQPVSRAYVGQLEKGERRLTPDPMHPTQCPWHKLAPALAIRAEDEYGRRAKKWGWALAGAWMRPMEIRLLRGQGPTSRIGIYGSKLDGLVQALAAAGPADYVAHGVVVVPVDLAFLDRTERIAEITNRQQFREHINGVLRRLEHGDEGFAVNADHHQARTPVQRVRVSGGVPA